MQTKHIAFYLSTVISFWACSSKEEKSSIETTVSVETEDVNTRKPEILAINDTVYVPVYSEIFSRDDKNQLLLTSTLSIHNTSLKDSLYIYKIEYYSTDGKLIRNYSKNGKWLKPLQTKNIVIDQIDKEGGVGANFIVYWGANKKGLKPLMQSIMVIADGPKSFAFTSDGISTTQ